VAGLFVDILGLLENEAAAPCLTIATPYGIISVVPAELAVVERTLPAFCPAPDPNARAVAKKMLAVCVSGDTPVDWDEIRRLAAHSRFSSAPRSACLITSRHPAAGHPQSCRPPIE
jgi:hypothetical protein